MYFEEAALGVRQTQKVLVLPNEKIRRALVTSPHPPLLASSLKHILAIRTIKLEGKRDLWISSEVTLSGGRYEDIYTWRALTHRQ